MSKCNHTGIEVEFPTCKVTGNKIKDCPHCKTPCEKTHIPMGFCAHCNVSKFTASTVTSVKSAATPKPIKSQVKRGIAFQDVAGDEAFLAMFPSQVKAEATPDQFECSYCHNLFSTLTVNKTEGISEIRKIDNSEIWKDSSGEVHIKHATGHMPTKVVACPDCAGNIKPLYRKDGTLKHKGTIWGPIND